MTTATMELNKRYNGVEITFSSKPAASVRDQLKSSGFRWHATRKLWYASATDQHIALASSLVAKKEAPAAPAPAPKTAPSFSDPDEVASILDMFKAACEAARKEGAEMIRKAAEKSNVPQQPAKADSKICAEADPARPVKPDFVETYEKDEQRHVRIIIRYRNGSFAIEPLMFFRSCTLADARKLVKTIDLDYLHREQIFDWLSDYCYRQSKLPNNTVGYSFSAAKTAKQHETYKKRLGKISEIFMSAAN